MKEHVGSLDLVTVEQTGEQSPAAYTMEQAWGAENKTMLPPPPDARGNWHDSLSE